MRINPAFNGSTALQYFECGNAVEIHNGIIFDFYLGLPHIGQTTVNFHSGAICGKVGLRGGVVCQIINR